MGIAKARGATKKKVTAPAAMDALSAAERALGRCECTGQCGQNHAFREGLQPVRCNAPHGCNVVRKKDWPSCWQLATIQGFADSDDRGPRTADKDGIVRRGRSVWSLAYPDLYDLDKVVQIWLEPVPLQGVLLMVCMRCKVMAERKAK